MGNRDMRFSSSSDSKIHVCIGHSNDDDDAKERKKKIHLRFFSFFTFSSSKRKFEIPSLPCGVPEKSVHHSHTLTEKAKEERSKMGAFFVGCHWQQFSCYTDTFILFFFYLDACCPILFPLSLLSYFRNSKEEKKKVQMIEGKKKIEYFSWNTYRCEFQGGTKNGCNPWLCKIQLRFFFWGGGGVTKKGRHILKGKLNQVFE